MVTVANTSLFMCDIFSHTFIAGINRIGENLFNDHPAGFSEAAGGVVEEVATCKNIFMFGGWAVVICFLALVILFLISRHLLKIKTATRNLKGWFAFAWVLAFVVYDVGMYTGQYISLLSNAPMAVLHAFETFLLGSDISAIHEPFHNSWVFMLFFSCSHALSAFVSTLFIVKVFGFNLIQKLRLFRESLSGKSKPETYVFWGINNATYRMVKSINDHYNGDKAAFRIIVVKTSNDEENSSESTIGINKVFEFLKLKDSELKQLQDLGCLIANSSRRDLDSVSGAMAGTADGLHDIIRGELRLRSLARILTSDKTTERIHFLVLSDDDKQNLHDVSVMLADSTLNGFAYDSEAVNNRKVTFYCHARYNGVHRVIEDLHCSNNMEVRVIDSSHINVELLKTNDDVLPVNFVDVEPDATVSSAFNAMIIGFSEVGQDATRFLYEFGAFVKSGSDDDHAVRSDFHLDVVDNRMEEKAGAFVANAPAIAPSLSFVPELNNPDALIELHNENCCSVNFYKMLEEKIKTLNYVVIATEDDELNMTIGIRIFRAATRYRENLDKLCILIRIHNDDDRHFSRIAEYYNKLWASQDVADVAGASPNRSFKITDSIKLPLYIFGQDEDVYTYGNIIDNSMIHEAIEYKEKYAASTEENYSKDRPRWYKEIEELLQSNDEYHTSYARLMKLRRTQRQDIANSQHRRTKELLRDKSMKLNGICDFQWSTLQRYNKQIEYSSVSGVTVDRRIVRFLTVLAQTEHLRWNASHEILGYVHDSKGKNEIRLHHNCLTDWEKLDEEKRSYDHNVVDITLGIIAPENKIKNDVMQ